MRQYSYLILHRAVALLNLLVQGDEQLQQRADSLLSLYQYQQKADREWQDKDTQLMEERLNSLIAASRTDSRLPQAGDVTMEDMIGTDEEQRDVLPEGWLLILKASWCA